MKKKKKKKKKKRKKKQGKRRSVGYFGQPPMSVPRSPTPVRVRIITRFATPVAKSSSAHPCNLQASKLPQPHRARHRPVHIHSPQTPNRHRRTSKVNRAGRKMCSELENKPREEELSCVHACEYFCADVFRFVRVRTRARRCGSSGDRP